MRQFSYLLPYLLLTAALLPAAVPAAPDAEQWRADLAQLDAGVRERHLAPFHTLPESEWAAMVSALNADIPALTDTQIIVRMAALVAAIGDGHTRLTLPRRQPVLGLRVGHTPTPDPNDPALRFDRLPVSFYLFEEGLYITEATSEYADLPGSRVLAFDDTPVSEALEKIKPVVHHDNPQGLNDMAPDRLAIPEVLFATGIAKQPDELTLTLRDGAGRESRVELVPIGDAAVNWQQQPADPPLALSRGNRKFWHAWLNDGAVLYIHLYEIDDDEGERLVPWFAALLREAVERGTRRLVLDLRRNYGGDSSHNWGMVMALKDIGDFDRRGNTVVLIGRSTFSAAQNLVNDLEQWTRALLIGEPTGARPGSYGDSRKIRLDNSGLTVRVSTRYHPDWLGRIGRQATPPDVPVAVRAEDWFAGRDAGLATALDYQLPADPGEWYRQLFASAGFDHATVRLWQYRDDPVNTGADFSAAIADVARDYLEQDRSDEAYYTALLAQNLFPASPPAWEALAAVLEARGENEAAAEARQTANALRGTGDLP